MLLDHASKHITKRGNSDLITKRGNSPDLMHRTMLLHICCVSTGYFIARAGSQGDMEGQCGGSDLAMLRTQPEALTRLCIDGNFPISLRAPCPFYREDVSKQLACVRIDAQEVLDLLKGSEPT